MTELISPALGGAAAGLGVAMPMGAMSVLLLQEAMRHRRTAVAAAAGIAVVDLVYAALATALGPWVASHVSPIEAWVRLASALILLAIAGHGLAGSRRGPAATGARSPGQDSAEAGREAVRATSNTGTGTATGTGTGTGIDGPGSGTGIDGLESGSASGSGSRSGTGPGRASGTGPGRASGTGRGRGSDSDRGSDSGRGSGSSARPAKAFARYVGLTALNPTTALYFAALTTAQGAALGTGAAGAAFLVGVGAASLLWQQTLVAFGSLFGARVSDTVRVWTFRLGYGLVAAYAIKIALPLP
uniref:LysE family transporter n=1 Tax=Streptomyces sp. NBC_00049 TaxID=2903617 RepID=A0AAU2JP84_9ACTN